MLVAEAVDQVAVCDGTEEVADVSSVAETGLPGGGELVPDARVEATIFLSECGLGVEVADEHDVVALHDDGHRHDDGPADSLAVGGNGLPEGHGVLGLGAGPSILEHAIRLVGAFGILLQDGGWFANHFVGRHGESR